MDGAAAIERTNASRASGETRIAIGVVQFPEKDSAPFEYHKPVPLSLFGLRKSDLKSVKQKRREILKKAEDSFLDGSPEEGCRIICEELEAITRRFAQHSYQTKWWKVVSWGKPIKAKVFTTDSWATMLQRLDERLVEQRVKKKLKTFSKASVAGVRHHTNWRNSLSHKPKGLKERTERDARLRTMFEATRDLLVDWYRLAKAVRLGA